MAQVQDLGLGLVQSLEFRQMAQVQDLGLGLVQSLEFRQKASILSVPPAAQDSGLWFRVQGLGFRVQGLGKHTHTDTHTHGLVPMKWSSFEYLIALVAEVSLQCSGLVPMFFFSGLVPMKWSSFEYLIALVAEVQFSVVVQFLNLEDAERSS